MLSRDFQHGEKVSGCHHSCRSNCADCVAVGSGLELMGRLGEVTGAQEALGLSNDTIILSGDLHNFTISLKLLFLLDIIGKEAFTNSSGAG